jgi:hypothetical protein
MSINEVKAFSLKAGKNKRFLGEAARAKRRVYLSRYDRRRPQGGGYSGEIGGTLIAFS